MLKNLAIDVWLYGVLCVSFILNGTSPSLFVDQWNKRLHKLDQQNANSHFLSCKWLPGNISVRNW